MVYNQSKEEENLNGIWEFSNENVQQNKLSVQERKSQVSLSNSRKIKPVQNPALKLKTPIAYQRDSDPNMLPIEKEGRGKTQMFIFNFIIIRILLCYIHFYINTNIQNFKNFNCVISYCHLMKLNL